jgi:hypothetical protein
MQVHDHHRRPTREPRKGLDARIDGGEADKPLIAGFGGIPLKRQKYTVLTDRAPNPTHQDGA